MLLWRRRRRPPPIPQCALVDRFYDTAAVDAYMRFNRSAAEMAAHPYTGNLLDIWCAILLRIRCACEYELFALLWNSCVFFV